MSASRVQRWRTAIRTTSVGTRLAIVLWIAWALVVWNVVFDRVLVVAGRRYVYAAAVSADQSNVFIRIEDWMRPAVSRGFWTATAAASLILVTLVLALVAVRVISSGPARKR